MVTCHDMKEGQVYVCSDCGLELEVINECKECQEEECGCQDPDEEDHDCGFSCCGKPLELKK